jgi:hypothetical protein
MSHNKYFLFGFRTCNLITKSKARQKLILLHDNSQELKHE